MGSTSRVARLLEAAATRLEKLLYAECNGATAGSTAVRLETHTGAGVQNVADGYYSYTITNIGGAAATVDGESFPDGASVTYTAYYDAATKEFKRPDGVSFDPLTSTLLIEITP